MNAHLIIIGDEILIGQIQDTNSNWIATQLNLQGIQIQDIHTIGDTEKAIREALDYAMNSSANLILCTGGLGPTKDDITKKTMANYFGMSMSFHQGAWDNLNELFARFKRPVGEEYRDQCLMPDGAIIVKNPVGTAPGMIFEQEEKVLISMPGVPSEMKYLMTNEVLPYLHRKYPVSPIAHRTILTVGVGETQLSGMLDEFENKLPENMKLAYLPYLGGVRMRLTAKDLPQETLETQLEEEKVKLLSIIGKYVFGFENDTLPLVIGNQLKALNATMATAESCTGGNIARKITEIPGASAYFAGATVAYNNTIKSHLLGVSEATLDKYGAVSQEVVAEMAKGAIEKFGVDYSIAVSGIAGPDGGTTDKPVGMVCVAVASKQRTKTHTFYFGRDRVQNVELTTTSALEMLRRFLLE